MSSVSANHPVQPPVAGVAIRTGHSPGIVDRFQRLFRKPLQSPNSRKSTRLVGEIIQISDRLQQSSAADLQAMSARLRLAAHSPTELNSILPQAYGLVRECARRVHRQSHYEVQILAGISLFKGGVVEMATGEGKTLSALLPAYLYALVGKGCHVVTANDYLAIRDAEFAKSVFELLGVSVGCIDESLERGQRRQEYQQDVTYGTAREFGFDFLKDQLGDGGNLDTQLAYHSSEVAKSDGTRDGTGDGTREGKVQRGHFFALVDEADSVMIDDARTPLLIADASENSGAKQAMIRWCHRQVAHLLPNADFEPSPRQRIVKLTRNGSRKLLQECQPEWIQQFGVEQIFQQCENALCATLFFQLGRHYVVQNGEISIVDESTGRISEGRKWQNGLHQAIEVKENLEMTVSTKTMARVTVQSFFRRYQHLAGITGTAESVSREFKKVYGLSVAKIPTRLPSQRVALASRIFPNNETKDRAIAVETQDRLRRGQPILIGTPSVRVSQRISAVLAEFGISHEVLNCLQHQQESTIIRHAGAPGRVTVATNMAGRGTDIHVTPEVLRLGGLHIIATEMHTSSRIDRQLMGRAARQGQPGSFQLFLSLEDELFAAVGISNSDLMLPGQSGTELGDRWLSHFERAQKKSESMHEKQRLELLDREKQRNKICRQIGLDPCLEMLDE